METNEVKVVEEVAEEAAQEVMENAPKAGRFQWNPTSGKWVVIGIAATAAVVGATVATVKAIKNKKEGKPGLIVKGKKFIADKKAAKAAKKAAKVTEAEIIEENDIIEA